MAIKDRRNTNRGVRQPFWLPASSFYFLVAGFAVATFFLIILLFHDGDTEVEWVSAGLVASGVLVAGVFLREIVLRSVRERHIAHRNLLDRNIRSAVSQSGEFNLANKFTLEKNAAALNVIQTKSDAAKIFGRISAGHREVFDLCVEYRRIVADELPQIHPNSPRLDALTRGNRYAAGLQKYHLLKWAEIEARELAEKASKATSLDDREKYADEAMNVIQFAAGFYPAEPKLNASKLFIEEFSVETRIERMIRDADSAADAKDIEEAEKLYGEILDLLDANVSKFDDPDLAGSIQRKIEALRAD